jgi:hypothetical protein
MFVRQEPLTIAKTSTPTKTEVSGGEVGIWIGMLGFASSRTKNFNYATQNPPPWRATTALHGDTTTPPN